MTELLLGIDIGTSNIKAILATPTGQVVASAQAAYVTRFPRQGWAEQDPLDWWRGTVESVRAVLAQAEAIPGQIKGIGVSGQGCAVSLIDQHGDVIRPAIIWMDTRSEPQCQQLRGQCADLILQRNGKAPAPYNADPVLMWLQKHEPEQLQRAQVSLTSTGYINYRLTGEAVTNVSDASILFAFDLFTQDWSGELIAQFGVRPDLYPRVAACDAQIGTLTAQAAEALGLEAGIPVVAGGEDTSAAGLAMGVALPGQALLSLGTAGTLYAVQDHVVVYPQLLAFSHVLPGEALLGGSMVAVGGAFNWIRKVIGDRLTVEEALTMAESSPPGANNLIFLPYLSGELQPINDGNARGAFVGLSMSTTPADMVRAVIEGTAFAIAHNTRLAAKVGTPITEIRAVGGPTQSPFWCQVIADVSVYPVNVMDSQAGAPLGDALLAGKGVGLIDDLAKTAIANAAIAKVYTPTIAHTARYDALYNIYTQLYPQLTASFAALSQIEQG